MYGKNSVKIIVDIDGLLWLNEKHIKEGLHHKNLRVTTAIYFSDLKKKHRYKLVDESKQTA